MGGRVTSAIHCDMVTAAPPLRVDGLTVVDRGRLAIATADWQETNARSGWKAARWRRRPSVARSGVQAAVSADYRLQGSLRPEPGRVRPARSATTLRPAGNSLYNLLLPTALVRPRRAAPAGPSWDRKSRSMCCT